MEKGNQIRYCEEETKKQAEAIGVLTASNSFRSHKLNQLDLDCNRFNEDVVSLFRFFCNHSLRDETMTTISFHALILSG